jgi:hypothetical protein
MRLLFKSLALFIFATLVTSPVAQAQTDFAIGSIIKNFELPQRDKDGNMKLLIFGEQATVISANRVKMEKLRIDLYQDGKADVRITSPESDFWKQENRLTTTQGVAITHPSFSLTSQKMDWELDANRGLFQGGVTLSVQKKTAVPTELLKP